jgi:hypothetical protein
MSEAGVLSGRNNAFHPQSTATRAEVAQMFRNFMRFVVAVNDGAGETQPVAAALSNATAYAYIDRRAVEAIERALTEPPAEDDEMGIDYMVNLLFR